MLNYKNLQFKQFIVDIVINFYFFRNFASIKHIRKKIYSCLLPLNMVDFYLTMPILLAFFALILILRSIFPYKSPKSLKLAHFSFILCPIYIKFANSLTSTSL